MVTSSETFGYCWRCDVDKSSVTRRRKPN